MNSHALKAALSADIKSIRMLSPDIIPARIYYGSLLKTSFSFFWKIWLIVGATIAYPCFHYPKSPFTTQLIVGESIVFGFFISLIALLILCSPISSFVLFRFQLKTHLKTGELLERKFKQVAVAFIGFFVIFSLLLGSYAHPEQIPFVVVFSFLLGLGATCFVVNMELKRIGLSTMYTVINEFFTKSTAVDRR